MVHLRTTLVPVCIAVATAPMIALNAAPMTKPEFGSLQCRADAQKWTHDPFDKGGAAVMVNGQLRSLPHLNYGVTASELLIRAHEMDACIHEDSAFEKQFATYSSIASSYNEERIFRYEYFLTRHNLDEQFRKEDAQDFKQQGH